MCRDLRSGTTAWHCVCVQMSVLMSAEQIQTHVVSEKCKTTAWHCVCVCANVCLDVCRTDTDTRSKREV